MIEARSVGASAPVRRIGSEEIVGQNLVGSLDRGLSILEMFSSPADSFTVSAMAAANGIPSASAYRIVRTLEQRGFLRRSGSPGEFTLGLRLIRLGWLVQESLDVRTVARPFMQRVAADAGETAVLMVPQDDQAICVECFEGSSAIRPRSITVGEGRPYNAGAVPGVLLAHLADDHRELVLSRGLPAVTARTVTDIDRLRCRLAQMRADGFAYSADELIEGTAAVAAPVFKAGEDAAVAALGLTGIKKRIRGLEQVVVDAAVEISAALGAGTSSRSK